MEIPCINFFRKTKACGIVSHHEQLNLMDEWMNGKLDERRKKRTQRYITLKNNFKACG